MRKKQTVAIIYYVVKAFDIVKNTNEDFEYFKMNVEKLEGSEIQDHLWYYEFLYDEFQSLLDKALDFFDIREDEIPSYSRLLADLCVKDITFPLIKKALVTLADAMPLSEEERFNIDHIFD